MPPMRAKRPVLADVIARLEAAYGDPGPPPSTDPFELVVWENAGYLVDDDRRAAVVAALKKRVGLRAEAILAAPIEVIAEVIRDGGIHPRRRADKLHDAAAILLEIGAKRLKQAVRAATESPAEAKKLLKRFPGIGDPGADKILLFARARRSLAPASNALRVLVRLGFGEELSDYGKTYRLATEAIEPELDPDIDRCLAAHLLLRRHGQEICKRTRPRCEACPLAGACRHYAAGAAVRAR